MPHPDEGLIHAWLDGELDDVETARVAALVASDPEWAAAAAEARGLVAASSRIVGSLDRVPANVIPNIISKTAAPARTGRTWMLRAAAVLVLIGGSAVVLNRASIDTVEITIPAKIPAPAAPPVIASVPPPTPAAPVISLKSSIVKKELADSKQKTLADKDIAAPAPAPATEARADAATGGAAANLSSARRAAAAPAAPAPLQQGALSAQNFAAQKTTRLPSLCFSQREPRDSVGRIIRLDRDALDDSIRLEKLTQHGDTLAAVAGPLRAVRAPCPAP
jgi:hypothetical protein